MATITRDTPGMRRARYIRNRTEEVVDDLAAPLGDPHRDQEFQKTIQWAVWEGAALGNHWRGLIAYLSGLIAEGSVEDFRSLAPVLRPAAHKTIEVYGRVLEIAKEIHTAGQPVKGLADLELVSHESRNILAWINSWPSSTPEYRAARRDEIDRGEVSSIEEFVHEVQGAS